jgi:hypothetical protein
MYYYDIDDNCWKPKPKLVDKVDSKEEVEEFAEGLEINNRETCCGDER